MDNSTIIRSYTPPEVTADEPRMPDPEPNRVGAESSPLEAPVEDASQATLNALGIDDLLNNLPSQDRDLLGEVGQYISDIIKNKGIDPTESAFKKTLNDLKWEMDLDPMASPQTVLDRIGGVVKAWKGLSFISNPQEKRSLFMKLARMGSSAEMNKFVYQQMEAKKIWQ